MTLDPDQTEYGIVKLTHHATIGERVDTLRRRPGRKSTRPECFVIGHAWTEEGNREGGSMCMVCQIVRFP